MPGLGTIINTVAILAGGLLGLLFKKFLNERIETMLVKTLGVCVLFIGTGGTLSQMLRVTQSGALETTGTMMLIVCFVLGSAVGELLDLEGKFEGFGVWLRRKTHNESDTGFLSAFINASLTVCIGAMAIVGSIQDGLTGDWSTLALKGALDAVIVCAMAASMGRGCLFSALPVAVLQGGVTALATLLHPIMTEVALANLSLVGSALIFCVGINLIWHKTFKPANMLPAVVIAAALAFV